MCSFAFIVGLEGDALPSAWLAASITLVSICFAFSAGMTFSSLWSRYLPVLGTVPPSLNPPRVGETAFACWARHFRPLATSDTSLSIWLWGFAGAGEAFGAGDDFGANELVLLPSALEVNLFALASAFFAPERISRLLSSFGITFSSGSVENLFRGAGDFFLLFRGDRGPLPRRPIPILWLYPAP